MYIHFYDIYLKVYIGLFNTKYIHLT